MIYFLVLSSILLGYVIGLVQKGITVNINHKDTEIPKEYNKSLAGELPEEVQLYYNQTKGFNQY